jgi:succinate dehydrogenase / fumarate reductase iron-sulfur subunit
MNFNLRVWRQKDASSPGKFVEYQARDIPAQASFLEMLDIVNNGLEEKGEEPIHFEHDCREGICGCCGLTIDGQVHGPGARRGVTTCQVYLRDFQDGQTITIEPFRATAFPVLRDLVIDRSAFDRILISGGYISVNTGGAPDANAIPVSKDQSEGAMDAAACIGCGACVASCKNASAMLFVGAKVSHLGLLPQGQPEREKRVLAMVETMDRQGFGNCTNEGECEAKCPKKISVSNIARLNREYLRARFLSWWNGGVKTENKGSG